MLAWLGPAYLLEFEGENTFTWVWAAGLFSFAVNTYCMLRLIRSARLPPRALCPSGPLIQCDTPVLISEACCDVVCAAVTGSGRHSRTANRPQCLAAAAVTKGPRTSESAQQYIRHEPTE